MKIVINDELELKISPNSTQNSYDLKIGNVILKITAEQADEIANELVAHNHNTFFDEIDDFENRFRENEGFNYEEFEDALIQMQEEIEDGR